MNWVKKLLERDEKDRHHSNLSTERGLLALISQKIKLIAVLTGIGVFFSLGSFQLADRTLTILFPQDVTSRVDLAASKITVKIWSEDFLGSGFIIQQQSQTYTVITNKHVLRGGKAPYSIQTPDGKIYPAQLSNVDSAEYDLALLQFISTETYATADIGNSSSLEVGEPAFAAGFPLESNSTQGDRAVENTTDSVLPGFTLKSGRIQVILDRVLEEGYAIAYTNDVQKGMSGGPLLDRHGAVIGVNGKHAFPLWEAPDFYRDGSQPCSPMQELITRSSLAIPIETGISLTSRFKVLKTATSETEDRSWTTIILDSDPIDNPLELIAQMQAEAEATKNCQNLRASGAVPWFHGGGSLTIK